MRIEVLIAGVLLGAFFSQRQNQEVLADFMARGYEFIKKQGVENAPATNKDNETAE